MAAARLGEPASGCGALRRCRLTLASSGSPVMTLLDAGADGGWLPVPVNVLRQAEDKPGHCTHEMPRKLPTSAAVTAPARCGIGPDGHHNLTRAEAVLDAHHHRHRETPEAIRREHADGIAASYDQAPGQLIRAEAQLIGRSLHASARFLAELASSIQRHGHRPLGHARQLRNVATVGVNASVIGHAPPHHCRQSVIFGTCGVALDRVTTDKLRSRKSFSERFPGRTLSPRASSPTR